MWICDKYAAARLSTSFSCSRSLLRRINSRICASSAGDTSFVTGRPASRRSASATHFDSADFETPRSRPTSRCVAPCRTNATASCLNSSEYFAMMYILPASPEELADKSQPNRHQTLPSRREHATWGAVDGGAGAQLPSARHLPDTRRAGSRTRRSPPPTFSPGPGIVRHPHAPPRTASASRRPLSVAAPGQITSCAPALLAVGPGRSSSVWCCGVRCHPDGLAEPHARPVSALVAG